MSAFNKTYDVPKAFFQTLEDEVAALGGDVGMILDRLGKKSVLPAIKQLASAIVEDAKELINSFRAQIKAGKYNYTYGFADNPEKIEGQQFHFVTNETELDHPGKTLTNQQVYERYGDKMASLSELLDYGIKNPEMQRQFPIGIVWKVGDQFWFAYLFSLDSDRELNVYQEHPYGVWNDDFRFLVRK